MDTGQDLIKYRLLCDDLVAEEASLDEIVFNLDRAAWSTATPAQGWDVQDQIGHLAISEDLAALAVSDTEAFAVALSMLRPGSEHSDSDHLHEVRQVTPEAVLEWWRSSRVRTVTALKGLSPSERLSWVGPPMSAMSFASARLMETWAHGQDVVDALDIERTPTDRLIHVAQLGFRTRRFSYENRGLAPPVSDVRVELRSPSGLEWVWGDATALDRVVGSALDFCLVVSQRRTVTDTTLNVIGGAAIEWMKIAQAFAGPPSQSQLSQKQ